MHRRRMAALAVPLVAAAATPAFADLRPVTSTGPSTTTPPYVIPAADGVRITSLLTVDDARGIQRLRARRHAGRARRATVGRATTSRCS